MATQTPDPSTGDVSGASTGRAPAPVVPRWVKLFGIVLLAVAVMLALALIFGGGRHGPSRHTGAGGHGGHAPSVLHLGSGARAA